MKGIETREEYDAAMKRVDELMDAEAGTPEAEELSALADHVVAYEEKHFPIDADVTCSCIDFHGEDPACKLHHAEEIRKLLAVEAFVKAGEEHGDG